MTAVRRTNRDVRRAPDGLHVAASFRTYPTPRTVWITRGSPPSSSFFRRLFIETSTTFDCHSKLKSQTCSRSRSGQDAPGIPEEVLQEGEALRREGDLAVPAQDHAVEQVDRDVAERQHRGELLSERRRRARTRARSSSSAKGLVR
jgi:hypothetical protein